MLERLKVALVHQTYSRMGGREHYVAKLVDGLLGKGHEVHLFCAKVRAEPPEGLHIHRVFRLNINGLTRSVSFAIAARARLRGHRFDIVHGFGDAAKQDVLGPGPGCHREFRKRVLLSPEAPVGKRAAARISPYQWVQMWMESARLKRGAFRKLMVNSRMVRDQIGKYFDINDEDVRVVYNGVDLERFDPERLAAARGDVRASLGLGEGTFAILFVGSGFFLKGLDILLEAFGAVAARLPEARLLVVGRDRRRRAYERQSIRNGLGDRVRFLGTTEEPEMLYAAADIFVLPSRYDASANTVLEAMACGLPVITSSANGAKEFIKEGREGFVLEDHAGSEGLAALILKLSSEEKRKAMGRAAREKAEQLPLERNLEETLGVYGEVVELKKRLKL
jgi:UDP-glucose:(heptosyl)LPS alpha-1,3-glucosyltransferase